MTTQRATYWSLTINHPGPTDMEDINRARQKGWLVDGQLEKGESGTQHYQIMLHTPQVRFSAVKKAFPRAHIEVARNVAALKAYVHKEETKEGDLPAASEYYPSLAKFWQLIARYMTTWEKDRLDACAIHEGYVKMYRRRDEEEATYAELRELFDEAVNDLIYQGYHVEHHAVNPANISAFKRYHKSIILRSYKEYMQQTCSQPDKKSFTDNDDDDEHTPCPFTNVNTDPASADSDVVVPIVHE